MPRYIAIDTETTGLDIQRGARPFIISTCDNQGELVSWMFDVDPHSHQVKYPTRQLKEIKKYLFSFDRWVFHNAVFDLRMLCAIDPSLINRSMIEGKIIIHDTQLMSHIVDSKDTHKLKDLGIKYLNMLDTDEKLLKDACLKSKRYLTKQGYPIPTGTYHYWMPRAAWLLDPTHPAAIEGNWESVCLDYAYQDVERTVSLYLIFKRFLKVHKLENVYRSHLQVIYPTWTIQDHGFHVHKDRCYNVIKQLQEHLDHHEVEMLEIVDDPKFNWRSGKQLVTVLYDQLDMPVTKQTATGNPSTDESTLIQLKEFVDTTAKVSRSKYVKRCQRFLHHLIEARKIETTLRYLNNYIDAQIDSYLYPSLNMTGTRTTRFSCSNPNAQNIGKGEEVYDDDGNKIKRYNLREVFGPPKGYVWYCIDYKSLQLIIYAYESEDQRMIEIFETGGDLHNEVAQAIFEKQEISELERRIAKNVNYGLVFGAKQHKIDATAGKEGAYDAFKDKFPSVETFMPKIIREASREGKVHTNWGYPLITDQGREYAGVNYIIQGDEGELVKRAMVLCDKFIREEHPDCSLILNVHDELIFQAPRGYDFPIKRICELMMLPGKKVGWHTPVDASLVESDWSKKTPIKL